MVDPGSTSEIVEEAAKEIVEEIKSRAKWNTVTVHVMGEMSLTYILVKKLSAIGIRCVCSTSYRMVKDAEDGKKVVEFHFERFREYE